MNTTKYLEMVKCNGMSLMFIDDQSELICSTAIKDNPNAIQFVKEQTRMLCEMSVSRDPKAIKFIKEPTQELCDLAMSIDPEVLIHIDQKFLTEDMYISYLRLHPEYLMEIKNPTERMCIEALNYDGSLLKYVLSQTEDMCKVAIPYSADVFEYVNEQTYELCKLAVTKFPKTIKLVRDKFRTDEIWKIVLSNDITYLGYFYKSKGIVSDNNCEYMDIYKAILDENPYNIQHFKYQNKELCEYAVSKKGIVIEYCDVKDEDIYRAAINNDPQAIKYIPKKYLSTTCGQELLLTAIKAEPELCSILVNQINKCTKDIKTKIIKVIAKLPNFKDLNINLTSEELKLAIEINPFNLVLSMAENKAEYIDIALASYDKIVSDYSEKIKEISKNPDIIFEYDNPNREMIYTAVSSNPYLIEYFDNDEELCEFALNIDAKSIKYMDNPSDELWAIAVSFEPHLLKDAPQTDDICKAALRENGYVIQYIENPSIELCEIALLNNAWALEYINDPSYYICQYAVNIDPYAIKYVPLKKQTKELCEFAIRKNPLAIQFIQNPTDKMKDYVRKNISNVNRIVGFENILNDNEIKTKKQRKNKKNKK